jgi:hypothetical protein
MLFTLILIVVLVFMLYGSHLISTKIFDVLKKKGSSNARAIRIITFIASFLIFFVSVALLFLYNITLQR